MHTSVSPLEYELNTRPSYDLPLDYQTQQEQERRDLTKFIKATNLHHFPRNGNAGLYGYTYRGDDIWLRDDLEFIGDQKTRTEIHEAIHTVDEYETRQLTEWIMDTMFPKQKPYLQNTPEYRN